MSKLMVLGAGAAQLPLIETAKRMGIEVIVVSRNGNYPGFAAADKAYYVDTTDSEGVLKIAREERIDGICTTGTDVAVKTIGRVVDALGLKGVGYESAMLSSNKWAMKQAFMDHGVRTSSFMKARNAEEANRAMELLKPPYVFKAVDSGGSKGIVKVSDASQLDYAVNAVLQATKHDYFIVEEFVEGIEFGAQAFIYDNKLRFVMIHGDLMFYGDTGVPIGHYVPYELSEQAVRDAHLQLERSIRALGLDNCAINADFIRQDDKVFVLEIGARAGATCLPELVSTYYGYNYYEQMVKAALGLSPEFPSSLSQACVCELLLSGEEGEIIGLDNDNDIGGDIIQILFDYRIGDWIPKFKVGTDRIGQLVVKGENLQSAYRLLEEVKKKIRITVSRKIDS
jgi:Formate-dependent phosphoribosylglycinamide formyltransferase (GAR transformylase)